MDAYLDAGRSKHEGIECKSKLHITVTSVGKGGRESKKRKLLLRIIMSHDLKSRTIKRHNVKKAVELLIQNNTKRKKSIGMGQVASNNKAVLYCNNFHNSKKKRRMSIVGFSKNLALLEMQIYIARQDWKHALNLFPKLLEYPNEIEPLVWKYAFIILLHMNDPSHLREFFEQCAGIHNSSSNILLERLLLSLQENN